jgi:outer membrane lipoprotein SlyB
MSRPAWQIQQQRIQQQRQIMQSARNHQEGIGYIINQRRLREQRGYKGGSGLGTAAVGGVIGGAVGGPAGAAIGAAVGWLLGKTR